jgi:pimeloyl-ACP methyl ester carboxylesterase
MVRAIVSRRGFGPELTFDDAGLAAIRQPTLYVYGTADPVGSIDLWRRVTGVLPQAELRLVDRGGHMPWFDDPRGIAADIRRFLSD